MKKILVVTLSIILCFELCACMKSEIAENVDNLILSIGEITLESEEKIIAAEDAVKALEESDYKQLDQLSVLEDARDKYLFLLALEVDKTIEKIGDVNLDSLELIEDARKAYDEADDSVQKKVSNYPSLEKAEADFSTLKIDTVIEAIDQIGEVSLEAEPLITQAQKAYDDLEESEKAKVSNISELEQLSQKLSALKVENVIQLIDNIGTVTLESGDKIKETKELYRDLNANEKKQITNYGILHDADRTLTQLKRQEKERIKQQALSKLRKETDKVLGTTWYFPHCFPTYINSRSNILPYINDGYMPILRLRLNYAGSSWVFFEEVIISVDGVRYSKSYDYFSVIRDNAGSMVGEYVDFAAGTEDIEMLRDIAESKETIVRFRGRERHSDLIVNQSDKSAINDVLTAYDVLNNS